MQKILYNLALIDLNKTCLENGIDISDTYLYKTPRKYTYTLHKRMGTVKFKPLASVTFHASSVPTHIIH